MVNDQVVEDFVHSKAMPALIVKLLSERQELLVLYNRLAELKPYENPARVQLALQRFCQLLVDYMALGHFEVYQCIEDNAQGTERCKHIQEIARAIHPHLAAITQEAVNFNDRYDTEEHCRVLDHLTEDLSALGQRLADRIELEDRLIGAIRSR